MSFLTFNNPVSRPQSDEAYIDDVFFQWWYFDGLLDNGCRLLTFIGHGDIRHPNEVGVNIVLRKPDGESIDEEIYFPKSALQAAPDNFDMKFSENCSVRYEKGVGAKGLGRYFLNIKFEKIEYELVIDPECPPFSPFRARGESPAPLIFAAKVLSRQPLFKKDRFIYTSFVPRGRISGTIKTGEGETIDAAGSIYHEHGMFSFPINSLSAGWLWMHVDHPEWNIFSGTLIPPLFKYRWGKTFVANGYVQHKDECLLAVMDYTGLMTRWTNIEMREPQAQGELSMVWNTDIKMAKPGLKVTAKLRSNDTLIYKVLDENPIPGVEQYWSQTVAKAEVEIIRGSGLNRKTISFEADAVVETMRNNA